MGRAIVREPVAFLMDEPLSNLDAKMRVQMRAEIARIQRDLKVTTIYVTHDQSEAMTLGDRVCVMRGGVLQQVASPQTLYDRPANLFVAGFIGSPAMNLVEAELAERERRPRRPLRPARARRAGGGARRRARRCATTSAGASRSASVPRTSRTRPARTRRASTVTVDIREDMGSEVFLHFALDAPGVKADELRELVGDEAVEAAEVQTHHHGSPFIAKVGRGDDRTRGRAGGADA